MGSIPRSGKSPREVNGNTLQYIYLGNPMDREAGRLQFMGLQKSISLGLQRTSGFYLISGLALSDLSGLKEVT